MWLIPCIALSRGWLLFLPIFVKRLLFLTVFVKGEKYIPCHIYPIVIKDDPQTLSRKSDSEGRNDLIVVSAFLVSTRVTFFGPPPDGINFPQNSSSSTVSLNFSW